MVKSTHDEMEESASSVSNMTTHPLTSGSTSVPSLQVFHQGQLSTDFVRAEMLRLHGVDLDKELMSLLSSNSSEK